jgi:hypothetical protein
MEIISYPVLEYLLGFCLLGFSGFLLYSACGGRSGINGFNGREWWQITIAVATGVVGMGFIVWCQS